MKRTFRHVLAKLRERLGHMPQKVLAEYAGTSVWSVQAIELGKLKLSQSLAFRISRAMGVDYGWLLENDLAKPPINQHGSPYSEEDLIRAQNKDKGVKEHAISRLKGKVELTQAYYHLRLVWEEAVKDPEALFFFLFRLRRFIDTERRNVLKVQEEPVQQEGEGDITILVDSKNGQFRTKEVDVSDLGLLFPTTVKSFDVMELDAYECREAFDAYWRPLWERTAAERLEDTVQEKPANSKRAKPLTKTQRASK